MSFLAYGQPLLSPVVPFVVGVPAPLPEYGLFSLEGFIPVESQGFAVNLQTGPAVNPRDDVALHLAFSFHSSGTELSVNTIQRNNWAVPVKFPSCPLRKMEPFQILILLQRRSFMIALKNQHFCEFHHRMDPSTVRCIAVDGGVVINRLLLEFPGGLQQGLQHQAPPSAQSAYSTYNPQSHMNQMMPPNVGPLPSYASFPAPPGYASQSNSSGLFGSPSMLPIGLATAGAMGALTGPLFYPGKQEKMCKKGRKLGKYYGGSGLTSMGMMGGSHMGGGGQAGFMGPALGVGMGAAAFGLGMKKMKHGKLGKHGHGSHNSHGWSHGDHHGKSSSSSSSSSSDSD